MLWERAETGELVQPVVLYWWQKMALLVLQCLEERLEVCVYFYYVKLANTIIKHGFLGLAIVVSCIQWVAYGICQSYWVPQHLKKYKQMCFFVLSLK